MQIALLIVAAIVLGLAIASIRIAREYERVVVFRVGRQRGARGPGLVLVIPLIERTRRTNLQVDTATEPWGVQVVGVETKDVGLPDTMKRAMARQAEAERERRAKVIAAEGEYQAAERLSQAARVISSERGALTLRTLQTLAEVATEHNSTLVLPIPMDILDREPVIVANAATAASAAGHVPNGGGA